LGSKWKEIIFITKLQIKSKEFEVAKIHFKVVYGLDIFCRNVQILQMRISNTIGCKYIQTPPKKLNEVVKWKETKTKKVLELEVLKP